MPICLTSFLLYFQLASHAVTDTTQSGTKNSSHSSNEANCTQPNKGQSVEI